MTSAIDQLGHNQLAGFVLVLARVGPLFLLAPPFSSRMIPPRAFVASTGVPGSALPTAARPPTRVRTTLSSTSTFAPPHAWIIFDVRDSPA